MACRKADEAHPLQRDRAGGLGLRHGSRDAAHAIQRLVFRCHHHAVDVDDAAMGRVIAGSLRRTAAPVEVVVRKEAMALQVESVGDGKAAEVIRRERGVGFGRVTTPMRMRGQSFTVASNWS